MIDNSFIKKVNFATLACDLIASTTRLLQSFSAEELGMRQVEKLLIFLASPGDVPTERRYVEQIVEELNRTVASEKSVALQVVRWENDAFPAYGQDAQALINAQIAEMAKYALFVGIMWDRVGTPTPRATSGTIEEFERAVQALKQNGQPDIWFYFRASASKLDTEDQLEQRKKVLAFKEKVQANGMPWTYKNASDFRDKFRSHMIQWLNKRTPTMSDATDISEKSACPIKPEMHSTVTATGDRQGQKTRWSEEEAKRTADEENQRRIEQEVLNPWRTYGPMAAAVAVVLILFSVLLWWPKGQEVAGEEKEPNDTFFSATPMAIGTHVKGSVTFKDDRDIYAFQTSPDLQKPVRIRVMNKSTTLRPSLWIYDAQKARLKYAYNHTAGGDTEIPSLPVRADSTFYAEVKSTMASTGEYELSVAFE